MTGSLRSAGASTDRVCGKTMGAGNQRKSGDLSINQNQKVETETHEQAKLAEN